MACHLTLQSGSFLEHTLDFTALCVAADQGHVDAVRVLLAAGADINARNQVCVPRCRPSQPQLLSALTATVCRRMPCPCTGLPGAATQMS